MDSRIFTLASAFLFGRYTGLKMHDQCDMSFSCTLQNFLSGVRSDVCGSRPVYSTYQTTRTAAFSSTILLSMANVPNWVNSIPIKVIVALLLIKTAVVLGVTYYATPSALAWGMRQHSRFHSVTHCMWVS